MSYVWIDITVRAEDVAAAAEWLLKAHAIEDVEEGLDMSDDGRYACAVVEWFDADVLDQLGIAGGTTPTTLFPFLAVVTYDTDENLLNGLVWDPGTRVVAEAELICGAPAVACTRDPDTGELVMDRHGAQRATAYLDVLTRIGFPVPQVSA